MGNHTIDCEFCGEDQRIRFPCCPQARQEKEEREQRGRARHQDREDRLKKYGLSYGWDGQVSADEVLAVLDRLTAPAAPCDCHDGVMPVLGDQGKARGTHYLPLSAIRPAGAPVAPPGAPMKPAEVYCGLAEIANRVLGERR